MGEDKAAGYQSDQAWQGHRASEIDDVNTFIEPPSSEPCNCLDVLMQAIDLTSRPRYRQHLKAGGWIDLLSGGRTVRTIHSKYERT